MMKVTIKKFEKKDIKHKVEWINNPLNNTYLHYDLPLEVEKTENWFEKNKDRVDRFDAVIYANDVPVGLIGLLSIDNNAAKAEYYIMIGNRDYLGKGIAFEASKLILNYAFNNLNLSKVYLSTETENVSAVKLYQKIGFKLKGILEERLFSRGRYVDRYFFGITKNEYFSNINTPINALAVLESNVISIKREDLIPFSFGGNKARKAKLFFDVIDKEKYNCVVTYGSSSSNHCRVVANMAAARKMPCYIISPNETSHITYNSLMMELFKAEIIMCPVNEVSRTIDKTIEKLKSSGLKPYFIYGGGHGNIGTQAFVNCYNEIADYEKENNVHFDYVFHATGTGTTQAGLICGQIMKNDYNKKIVGISIARKNPRGSQVVFDSIKEYLNSRQIDIIDEIINEKIIFVDEYTGEGYGVSNREINSVIEEVMIKYGIPLDSTYTGKAFYGMMKYIEKNNIKNSNILFIHTGGTPLYFDFLNNK